MMLLLDRLKAAEVAREAPSISTMDKAIFRRTISPSRRSVGSSVGSDRMKKVRVLGLGNLGLPTASPVRTIGHEVFGVDASPPVVERINQGRAHIVELDRDIWLDGQVYDRICRAHDPYGGGKATARMIAAIHSQKAEPSTAPG
jgi:hypothetical protein